MEILKLRSSVIKIKNNSEVLNSRFELVEERISKLEDR